MKYSDSESVNLEFKREIPKYDQIIKTITAFCNGHGGKLVLGVEDNGTVVGVPEERASELLESLNQAVFASIEPPIIPNIFCQRFDELIIVIIEVSSGSQKPYFRRSEGPTKGTYIRVGRITTRANEEMIEELHFQSRGIDYDRRPIFSAKLQDLSDEKFLQFLKARKNHGNPHINEETWRSYHLVASEHTQKFPTVTGILLFGKKPQFFLSEAMIICSHFSGNSGREIIATIDCEGTLFDQYHQALEFVTSRLAKSYSFEGPIRKDTLEIPQIALREAFLNAIAHRNYMIKAPIKIAIYDNRIEVFSPGQFPGPIDLDNLRAGITYLRNPAICKIFREVGYVEKLGSGIIEILDSYEERGLATPQLIEGKNYVKCILPREEMKTPPQTDEEKVLDLLSSSAEVTSKDIQKRLKISRATTLRRIEEMIDNGVLEKVGKTRSVRYRLKQPKT
ncbi:MAG: putative DNA binding domain-containing protein [Candidatus Algichlamydia australiensis]|nr:putative DNA binding domain-containing protein [Chlamydiales bacterium]